MDKEYMYESYGDVNFFDGGVLIRNIEGRMYHVILCDIIYDQENFSYKEYTIDIEMIEDLCESACKSARESYDIKADADDMMLAVAYVRELYLEPDYMEELCKNDIIDRLNRDNYINYIPWEYFSQNFLDDNREVIVDICNEKDNITRETFNDLESALDYFERRAEKGWSLEIISM